MLACVRQHHRSFFLFPSNELFYIASSKKTIFRKMLAPFPFLCLLTHFPAGSETPLSLLREE